MKISNKLYMCAVGMFLCCLVFWIIGEKDSANDLVIVPVLLGLVSFFLHNKSEEDKQ